jgi:hypothetical protein
MPGVGGDGEHRLCRGREQVAVDHRLVVVGDVAAKIDAASEHDILGILQRSGPSDW